MTDTSESPLVTFYVITYNQGRFVREAIEGALAQTYSPLEILVSDDCSTDDTFEIIQDAVQGYSGPHKIILNRNDRNLGLSEHVNRIMEMAAGELVVAADGDDVSCPERTQRYVDIWLKNEKPAALASLVSRIDAAGNHSENGDQWVERFFPTENETPAACLRRFCSHGSPRLVSCSAAWTKELFDRFGPLAPGIWFEDDVITLRAWLFDRIVFIPEALVSYRHHESNLVNRIAATLTTPHARRLAETAQRDMARHRREALRSYICDLDLALRQQWITRPFYDDLKRHVEKECEFYRAIEDWWDVGWTKRVASFLYLALSGRLKELRWCGPRLLPYRLFLSLGAIWSRARISIALAPHLFPAPESALSGL